MSELDDELARASDVLGASFIDHLATAARQHNVMISVSISPYVDDPTEAATFRDPNDPPAAS